MQNPTDNKAGAAEEAPDTGDDNESGGITLDDAVDHQNENCAVRAARLSFPPISEQNIELWFVQLDHWFIANDIRSDSQRFSTVVASMSSSMLQQVYDNVLNSPRENKYKTLKAAIVTNYKDSEQKRIQQLVSGLQLGDLKPSHLLSNLRRVGVCGTAQDETLLRGLWMQRLPLQLRTCLSTVGVDQPLTKLAEIADTVMETFRVGDTQLINAVNAPIQAAAVNESQLLRDEIRELARQVRDLGFSRGRSTDRSNRSRTPSAARPRPAIGTECWYHAKFGPGATKCREPCTYNPQKN